MGTATIERTSDERGLALPMALSIAVHAGLVLAMFLGPMPLKYATLAGLSVGLCWVATSLGVNYLFERRPLRLWLINGGYHVLQFTAFGLILGGISRLVVTSTQVAGSIIAFQLDHANTRVLITDREFAPVMQQALALAKVKPLIDDAIRRIRDVRGDTTITSFRNLSTSDSYGTDVNGSLRLGKVSGFASVSAYRTVTNAGSLGDSFNSDGIGWSAPAPNDRCGERRSSMSGPLPNRDATAAKTWSSSAAYACMSIAAGSGSPCTSYSHPR